MLDPDWMAPPATAQRYLKNPCAVCGWGKHMAIHNNPKLNGRGGPYHEWVPKQTESKREKELEKEC